MSFVIIGPRHILTFPNEVWIKILRHTVVLDRNIVVTQVCKGSNKFLHGKFGPIFSGHSDTRYSLDHPLDFPSVMLTCKKLYNLLNQTALFYAENTFEFDTFQCLQAYLSSITPARLQDIENVYLHLNFSWPKQVKASSEFLLPACSKLKKLTLSLSIMCCEHWSVFIPDISIKRWFQNVRCDTLELKPFPSLWHVDLEARLQVMTSRSRPQVVMTQSKLTKVRSFPGVLIHGDCRLHGEVNRFVSSRTRGKRARTDMLDGNGVFRPLDQPKFAVSGDLLWDLSPFQPQDMYFPETTHRAISDHQEVTDAVTSEKIVQFLVQWGDSPRWIHPSREQSWESLEVLLSNPTTHPHLVEYYASRSITCKLEGGQQVLDALRADSLTLDNLHRRNDGPGISCMERCIKARKKFQAKEEVRERKAAAKAEKLFMKVEKAAVKAGEKAGQKRKRDD